MILWRQTGAPSTPHSRSTIAGRDDGDSDSGSGSEAGACHEHWSAVCLLRASDMEDVYDLCWSPDDQHLLIGLTDNSAQVWDVQTRTRAPRVGVWLMVV